ncbi:MAG TPA: PEGA domain-containing protein [Anaeromyxobacter sp.]|nr:PEGA domain-containing protein [Anaeromyxobacter sp.]
MRPLAAALAVLLLPAAARPEAKPRLAVLDLAANGASKELAAAAGTAVANALDRLGAFQVITSEAIRSMLAFEKQRQMLGCTEAGCFAEIGGALGADWLVSGKVTRLAAGGGVPETFTLDLTLTSVRKGQREGSAIETGRSEAELLSRAGKGAQKLVQKILAGRAGRLVVTAFEPGAVVRVDDQVKGTTPLRGPIVLPAGPHALAVEKQGFVAFQKDVHVEAGKVVQEEAALMPSPDFVRAYEARQRKLRAGAWISTGVAVAGFAGAVALQASANELYGNESTPGTFLYDRQRLQAGVTTENGVDLRAEAASLQSDIQTRETWSYVSLGVGAAAAVAATYFWIAGDDPDRYAGFAEPTARLDVVPTPGGALAAVTVGF